MMYGTERWKPLDLRRRSILGPYDDELIVLQMLPKSQNRMSRYEVGHFEVEKGKSWFVMKNSGTIDPVKARTFYTIQWCHLPPETGPKF